MRTILAILLLATSVDAAGLSYGPNFTVITKGSDKYARSIRDTAETFRTDFASEWLGAAPDSAVRTVISAGVANRHSAFTLARDDASQKFHNIFVATAPENLTSTICHEVAHTVLATAYPHRLPPWAEEGIACRYDCDQWRKLRSEERFTPRVSELLDAKEVDYAAAESLVEYLLTKGDKPTLLAFADEGSRHGWGEALNNHYRIADVAELQRGWREWLEETRR